MARRLARAGHCGSAFGSGAVAAAGIDGEIGGVAGCSMVGSGATICQVGCWMTSTGSGAGVGSGSAASSAATGSGSTARARRRPSGSGSTGAARRLGSSATASSSARRGRGGLGGSTAVTRSPRAACDLGLDTGSTAAASGSTSADRRRRPRPRPRPPRRPLRCRSRRQPAGWSALFVGVELRVEVLAGAESTEQAAGLGRALLTRVRLVVRRRPRRQRPRSRRRDARRSRPPRWTRRSRRRLLGRDRSRVGGEGFDIGCVDLSDRLGRDGSSISRGLGDQRFSIDRDGLIDRRLGRPSSMTSSITVAATTVSATVSPGSRPAEPSVPGGGPRSRRRPRPNGSLFGDVDARSRIVLGDRVVARSTRS